MGEKMRRNNVNIRPNVPLVVALADPEGQMDSEFRTGTYQTTTGELLTLPRAGVVVLNLLEPHSGEEIEILKSWSGKYDEKSEWVIRLTHRSEMARAEAESAATPLEGQETGNPTPEPQKTAVEAPTPKCPACGSDRPDVCRLLGHQYPVTKAPEAPTPIRRPARRAPSTIPGLFDTRGTGTHGPAPAMRPEDVPLSIPLPAAAIGKRRIEGQIPANVAMCEILAFVKSDASTAGWDAESIQKLVSTVYIAAVQQRWITVWERPQ
jgi:hypothetical protein